MISHIFYMIFLPPNIHLSGVNIIIGGRMKQNRPRIFIVRKVVQTLKGDSEEVP